MLFHIEDDTLTVVFEGSEAFWSLKRRFVIRRREIMRVTWHETLTIPRRELGWRVGAAIPGLLFAGRFFAGSRSNLVYLKQPQGLFGDIVIAHVLDFELADAAYNRLLFTVENPDIASSIVAWWAAKS